MATAPTPQMAPAQALPTGQTTGMIGNISALLQLLGGQKTTQTSNPGDISALQATLGQLQGADYNAMLQSIFQQAGGQIPGIQAAMGNATGARSGGNSAVQAALQKLLQQTTIAGQQQIAQQQLQNQQTQVQAGQGIAQATKGTQQTQQQGTNVGKGAGALAQGLALTQLLSSVLKMTGQGTIQEAAGKVFGPAAASTATPATGPTGQTAMTTPAGAPVFSAPAPQMSMAPGMSAGINMEALLGNTPQMSTPNMAPSGVTVTPIPESPQMSYAPKEMFAPVFNINDYLGGAPAAAPEMSYAPADMFEPAFDINNYLY